MPLMSACEKQELTTKKILLYINWDHIQSKKMVENCNSSNYSEIALVKSCAFKIPGTSETFREFTELLSKKDNLAFFSCPKRAENVQIGRKF